MACRSGISKRDLMNCCVERYMSAEGVQVSLWRGDGCYHVRIHAFGRCRVSWESTRSLTEARKMFGRGLRVCDAYPVDEGRKERMTELVARGDPFGAPAGHQGQY